jgi:hypothetical protein
MSQREILFNIRELAHLAAEADDIKSCVGTSKYPDGMYGKALLLIVENGARVVAKVPNPNAGRPHFTTASEVVTMEFVCLVPSWANVHVNFLRAGTGTSENTRPPKVYAWSSRAQENKVGAECIIIEKLPGIGLDLVWPGMDIRDRLAIAKAVARYQDARVSVSFKQFGSLYHAPDLDRHTPQSAIYTGQKDVQISVTRSIIGRSTGHESVDDGRAGVESDRGPCKASLPRFVPLRSDRYFSGGTHWKSSEGRLAMGKCCTLRVSLGSQNHQSLSAAQESTKPPSTKRSRRCNVTSRWLNIYVQQTNPLPCHIYGAAISMSRIYSSIPKSSPRLSESYTNSQTELARLFHHACQPYFPDCDGPPFRRLERPRLPDNMA